MIEMKMMPFPEASAEFMLGRDKPKAPADPGSRFADMLQQREQGRVGDGASRVQKKPEDKRKQSDNDEKVRLEEARQEREAAAKECADSTASNDSPKKAASGTDKDIVVRFDTEKGKRRGVEGVSEGALEGSGLLSMLQRVNDLIEQLSGKKDATAGSKELDVLKARLKKLVGSLDKIGEKPLTEKQKSELTAIMETLRKVLARKEAPGDGSGKKDSSPLKLLQQVVDAVAKKPETTSRPEIAVVGKAPVKKGTSRTESARQVQHKLPENGTVEWKGGVRQAAAETGQHNISRDDMGAPAADFQKAGGGRPAGTLDKAAGRKIFNQIVERASVTHKSGMSEMRLQLKPEALGRVRMKLTLKDGVVSARLTVANAEVRQLLSDNLEVLGRELREIGINLADLDVSQQGQDERFRRGLEEVATGSPVGHAGQKIQGDELTLPPRSSRHAGQVDIVA